MLGCLHFMRYANIIGVVTASILLAGCGKKSSSPENSGTPSEQKQMPSPQSSSFTSTNALRLPSDAAAQALIRFDVSQYPTSGEKSIHLSVTTNDVVLIKRPSGAVAVVQFTGFGSLTDSGPLTASYRWRYRSASSQPVQSGTGQVRESYDQKPNADGKSFEVTPKADHDPTVRAGDIWIEWSYGTESSGYLYCYATRATIQVLSSDSFDKDL